MNYYKKTMQNYSYVAQRGQHIMPLVCWTSLSAASLIEKLIIAFSSLS